MAMLMTTMDWYRRTTGDASVNSAATRAGLVQSTLARQLQAGRLSPESVIAIARAYGGGAISGLIDTGHLTHDDVRIYGLRPLLANATDAEIAAEVMRRLGSPELDEPLS